MTKMNREMNMLDLPMEEIIELSSKIKNYVSDSKTVDVNIGINLGNLLTKTWGADNKHELFYTSAVEVTGRLSAEEIQSDDTLIKVNGKLYRVGLTNTTAGSFSQRNHDELTIVGIYAIARQLFSMHKKNLTATGNSKYRLYCAKIGLGLSALDYDILDNQKQLLEMFDGKNFIFEYMKAKSIINVEVMNIVQEGHCHIRFHSADYDYKNVVLLDMGSRTLDGCRFEFLQSANRNVITHKTSMDGAGTLSIMNKIANVIGRKRVDLLDVEPLLTGESIKVDSDTYHLSDFQDTIVAFIKGKINEMENIIDVEFAKAKAIVLIGGGANIMKKAMQDLYPGKDIIVPENAQYLNAEAYYIASHKKRNFKKLYE